MVPIDRQVAPGRALGTLVHFRHFQLLAKAYYLRFEKYLAIKSAKITIKRLNIVIPVKEAVSQLAKLRIFVFLSFRA